MSIKIYTTASPDTAISENNTFTNPFAITFDGQTGGVLQKKLYVRNSTSYLAYSGINLTVVDNVGVSVVSNSDGYNWKLSAGDIQPSDAGWDTITAGNTIVMSGLGTPSVTDTSTYLPFWVRVEVPRNAAVQTILDVQFQVTALEYIVP